MKKSKLSKRKQAALYCAVLASTPAALFWPCEDICKSLGVSTAAEELAWAARTHVGYSLCGGGCWYSADYRLAFAEAESLLRTGWSPRG